MADLNLNGKGIAFCLNQVRVMDFLKEYGTQHALTVNPAKDNYVAPILVKTDILSNLCGKLNAEVKEYPSTQIFALFGEDITE